MKHSGYLNQSDNKESVCQRLTSSVKLLHEIVYELSGTRFDHHNGKDLSTFFEIYLSSTVSFVLRNGPKEDSE